jgi:hypothetical protein
MELVRCQIGQFDAKPSEAGFATWIPWRRREDEKLKPKPMEAGQMKIDSTKILKLAAANGIQSENGVYFIPAEGGRLEVPREMFDDFRDQRLIEEEDSDGRVLRVTPAGRRAAGLPD